MFSFITFDYTKMSCINDKRLHVFALDIRGTRQLLCIFILCADMIYYTTKLIICLVNTYLEAKK